MPPTVATKDDDGGCADGGCTSNQCNTFIHLTAALPPKQSSTKHEPHTATRPRYQLEPRRYRPPGATRDGRNSRTRRDRTTRPHAHSYGCTERSLEEDTYVEQPQEQTVVSGALTRTENDHACNGQRHRRAITSNHESRVVASQRRSRRRVTVIMNSQTKRYTSDAFVAVVCPGPRCRRRWRRRRHRGPGKRRSSNSSASEEEVSSSESSYQKVRPRKSRGQKAKAPCPTSRHGGARHSSSSSAVNSNRRLPGATAYLEGGTLQTTTKLTEHQDIETTRNRNSSGEDAPPNTRSQQVSPPLQHPRGKGSKPKAAKAPAAKKPAKPKAKSAPAKRKEGKKPPYTAQGASKQEPGNKRKRSRSFLQEDSENSNSSPIPIAAKKTKVEQRPARQSSAVNKIYSQAENPELSLKKPEKGQEAKGTSKAQTSKTKNSAAAASATGASQSSGGDQEKNKRGGNLTIKLEDGTTFTNPSKSGINFVSKALGYPPETRPVIVTKAFVIKSTGEQINVSRRFYYSKPGQLRRILETAVRFRDALWEEAVNLEKDEDPNQDETKNQKLRRWAREWKDDTGEDADANKEDPSSQNSEQLEESQPKAIKRNSKLHESTLTVKLEDGSTYTRGNAKGIHVHSRPGGKTALVRVRKQHTNPKTKKKLGLERVFYTGKTEKLRNTIDKAFRYRDDLWEKFANVDPEDPTEVQALQRWIQEWEDAGEEDHLSNRTTHKQAPPTDLPPLRPKEELQTHAPLTTATSPSSAEAKSAAAKETEGKKPQDIVQGAKKQEAKNKCKQSRSFSWEDSEFSPSSPKPKAAKKAKVMQKPARLTSSVSINSSQAEKPELGTKKSEKSQEVKGSSKAQISKTFNGAAASSAAGALLSNGIMG